MPFSCDECGRKFGPDEDVWLETDGYIRCNRCWDKHDVKPLYAMLADYDRISTNYRYIRALIWELNSSPMRDKRAWVAIQRIIIRMAIKKRHYGCVYKMSHPDKDIALEVPYVITDDTSEALAQGYIMELATGDEVEDAIRAQVEQDQGTLEWKT